MLIQRLAEEHGANAEEDDDADTEGADRVAGPMADEVRGPMEQAFGADFGDVRIHEGPQAESRDAHAFAQGEDIHFAEGQYAPDTPSGRELLGHELAHVVQQREGRVAAPQNHGGVVTDAALEAEADEQGARAARGQPVGARAGAPSASTAKAPAQAKRTKADKKRAAFAKKVAKARRKGLTRPAIEYLRIKALEVGTLLDLRGVRLDGLNLGQLDLTTVDLTGASLRGTNLRGVCLGGLVRGADFSGADLRDAIVPADLPSRAKVSSSTRLPDSVRLHVPQAGPGRTAPGAQPQDDRNAVKAIAAAAQFVEYELADGPRSAAEMLPLIAALLVEEGAPYVTVDRVIAAGERAKRFTQKDGALYLYVDASTERHAPGEVVHRKVGTSWKPQGVARSDKGTASIDQHYMNVQTQDPATGQTITVTEEQVNDSRGKTFEGKMSLQTGHELAVGTEFIRDEGRRGEFQRGVADGKLVSGDGSKLDTTQSHSGLASIEQGTGGKQIYVMGRDGALYTADPNKESAQFLKGVGRYLHEHNLDSRGLANPSDQEVDELPWRVTVFHHSSFFAGDDVQGAGEIATGVDGAVKLLSNSSGHYKPDKAALLRVCDGLIAQGVDLSTAMIRFHDKDGRTFEFFGGAWVAARGDTKRLENRQAVTRDLGAAGTSALLRAKANGLTFPDKECERLFVQWADADVEQKSILGDGQTVDDAWAETAAKEFIAEYQATKQGNGVDPKADTPVGNAAQRLAAEQSRTKEEKSTKTSVDRQVFHSALRAFRLLGKPYDPDKLAKAVGSGGGDAVGDELNALLLTRFQVLPAVARGALKDRFIEIDGLYAGAKLAQSEAAGHALLEMEKLAPLSAVVLSRLPGNADVQRAVWCVLNAAVSGRLPPGTLPDGMAPHDPAQWKKLADDFAQNKVPNWILALMY